MNNNINVAVGGPINADYHKVYKTKFLKPGIPFSLQVTEPNTKYVIKHNFVLDGNVTIPEGCLLEFDGGSISNGTLVGQDTVLIYFQSLDEILPDVIREGSFVYNNTLSADEETLTEQGNLVSIKDKGIKSDHIDDNQILSKHIGNNQILTNHILNENITGNKLNPNVVDDEDIHFTVNHKLQLKDKAYAPAAYSGMGRVYLRKNIVNGVNILTQDMFYKGEVGSRVPNTNTIFVIQYDYDLNDPNGENPITIPTNCVLEFDGGSLSNGSVVGDFRVKNHKNTYDTVFKSGYNYDEGHPMLASDLGMIPNDVRASNINHTILKEAINKHIAVNIDDVYYLSKTSINLDKDLYLKGVNKRSTLYIEGDNNNSVQVFTLSSGCRKIYIENVSIKRYGGTQPIRLLYAFMTFVIDEIIIKSSSFEHISVCHLPGTDINYEETHFGIKRFNFIGNNTIGDNIIIFQDNVISEEFIVSNNVLKEVNPHGIWCAETNEFINKVHDYSCPFYIEDNIVTGSVVSNNERYNLFMLIETTNTVYYRRNSVQNIINVIPSTESGSENSACYDSYVTVLNYFSENNYFKNIASFLDNGEQKFIPDELSKSKGTGNIRFFKNNVWYNDYNEIKSQIVNKYPDFAVTDQQFRTCSRVALFWYMQEQEQVTFENNQIRLIDGDLIGVLKGSSTWKHNYVKKLIFKNNLLDCNIYSTSNSYHLFAQMSNSSVYVENNTFINHENEVKELTIFSGGVDQTFETIYAEFNNNDFVGFEPNMRFGSIIKGSYSNNHIIYKGYSLITAATGFSFDKFDTNINYNNDKIFYIYPLISKGKIHCVNTSANPNKYLYFIIGTNYAKIKFREKNMPDTKIIIFQIDRTNDIHYAYDNFGNLITSVANTDNPKDCYSDNNIKCVLFKRSKSYVFGFGVVSNSVTNAEIEIEIETFDTYEFKQRNSGNSSERPTAANIYVGFVYFDITLGKPIYASAISSNTVTWVDATGATV